MWLFGFIVECVYLGVAETMEKHLITFNPERALALERTLIHAYVEKKGVFADSSLITAPELLAVDGMECAPHDQANLLFFAIGSDHSVDSRLHYPLFREAYERDAQSVHPAYIASLSADGAREHFARNFRMNIAQTTNALHAASVVLAERYSGSPLQYFTGVHSVHDAVERIGKDPLTKLPGFREQLGKLLLKNYIALGLISFPDQHTIPPKVDRWNVRMSIGTGVLSFSEEGTYHATSLVDVLTDGWKAVALSEGSGFDGALVNNLIWAVGSTLCKKEDRSYCSACPLYDSLCAKLVRSYDLTSIIDTRYDVRLPEQTDLFGQLPVLSRMPMAKSASYGSTVSSSVQQELSFF